MPLIKTLVLLGAGIFFLTGCGRTASDDVSVKLLFSAPSEIRSGLRSGVPVDATAMDCYLVNIRGPEINPRYVAGQIANIVSADCLGWTAVSDTVSITQAVTQGVTMRIRPGDQRLIEVYGISGVPSCGGKQPPDLFNEGSPSVYLLGKTIQNIGVDTSVQITNTYSAATASDRVTACKTLPMPPLAGVGADNFVLSMVPYGLGTRDVIVGGKFTTLNGTSASRLARMTPDGTLDMTYLANLGSGFNNDVNVVSDYGNGSVYVGGNFTSLNSVAGTRLLRLRADGTRDTTFVVNTGFSGAVNAITSVGPGAPKVYVGGAFSLYELSTANQLTAINATNGVMVTGWSSYSNTVGTVQAMDIDPTGAFLYIGGLSSPYLARVLTATISTDSGFASALSVPNGAIKVVRLAPGDPSRIYIGGQFTNLGGVTANRIARVFDTGATDTTFATGVGFDGPVYAIEPVLDGTPDIYVGGSFTTYNGVSTGGIARLSPTGVLRQNFNVGTGVGGGSVVTLLSPRPRPLFDFTLMVGGNFSSFNGTSRSHIFRLLQNGQNN